MMSSNKYALYSQEILEVFQQTILGAALQAEHIKMSNALITVSANIDGEIRAFARVYSDGCNPEDLSTIYPETEEVPNASDFSGCNSEMGVCCYELPNWKGAYVKLTVICTTKGNAEGRRSVVDSAIFSGTGLRRINGRYRYAPILVEANVG